MLNLEQHLLSHLAEEYNEVTVEAGYIAKVLMKSLRFGLHSWHKGESNADTVSKTMRNYVDEFVDTELILLLLLEIYPDNTKSPRYILAYPDTTIGLIRAHKGETGIRLRLERLLKSYDFAQDNNQIGMLDLEELYRSVARVFLRFDIKEKIWLNPNLKLPFPTL